jgi:hypothetical protein
MDKLCMSRLERRGGRAHEDTTSHIVQEEVLQHTQCTDIAQQTGAHHPIQPRRRYFSTQCTDIPQLFTQMGPKAIESMCVWAAGVNTQRLAEETAAEAEAEAAAAEDGRVDTSRVQHDLLSLMQPWAVQVREVARDEPG